MFPLTMDEHVKPYSEIILSYFKKHRLILTDTDAAFPTTSGGQPSRNYISDLVKEWTEKYLSDESPFSSRVPGLSSFRPHVFRKIVATEFSNRGEFDQVEIRLQDSKSMALKHYIKNNPNLMIINCIKRRRSDP